MTPEIISVVTPLTTVRPSTSVDVDQTHVFERVPVLDVGFDCLTLQEAVETIERFIQKREPHQVCMANAYTVSLAQGDRELNSLLKGASLVLADGMSIIWGARWVNLKIPGRVAGPDLTKELCRLSAEKGYRLYFLGSTPENLSKLKDVLLLQWPNMSIAGMFSPSFSDKLSAEETATIIQRLDEAQPDILFVSMSAPKQEKWIADNLEKLKVPVCIGVGAAFDFLSGRVPRAPATLQKVGLEWLYRLWREPSRLWRRYLLGNVVYLSLLGRQLVRMKLR